MIEQAEILVDDADAPAQQGGVAPGDAGGVGAEDFGAAARGMFGEVDQFEQAGFAGTRRAGEPAEAAIGDVEADAAQDVDGRRIGAVRVPVLQPNVVKSDHSAFYFTA